MCGIAGLIAEREGVVREALSAMVSAQAHRGPDDQGMSLIPFGNRSLGLGHRRLSIQDVSMAGHQPMVHPQTADQIIFNGEIYNYPSLRRELESAGESFIGHSDTEALLYGLSRWGPAFLTRLEGMYALAFYSSASQTLLLARDPVGIKPLYLGRAPGVVAFASEVRALLASDLFERTLRPQGLAGLLAYGAMQHPYTLFEEIRSFPPGCYQVFNASEEGRTREPVAFWKYPAADPSCDERQVVERVERGP